MGNVYLLLKWVYNLSFTLTKDDKTFFFLFYAVLNIVAYLALLNFRSIEIHRTRYTLIIPKENIFSSEHFFTILNLSKCSYKKMFVQKEESETCNNR